MVEQRHTGCCGTALAGRVGVPSEGRTSVDETHVESAIPDSGDFGPTFERFVESTLRACGADACAVRMFTDAGGGRLHLVSAAGLGDEVARRQLDVADSCGVCGEAVADGQARTKAAGCACSRGTASGDASGRPFRQVAAIPVIGKNQTLGVLSLFFTDPAAVPEKTLATVRSLADLLGLTLDRASAAETTLRNSLAQERQMMGNEIHDSLCQTLAYMKMRMRMLQDAVHQHDELRAFRYITDCNEALAEAQSHARELITHYRAHVDQRGLLPAFEEMAKEFAERTGITLTFDNQAPDLHFSAEQEVQVLRIVQEAIANVGKHSKARTARLLLACTDDTCSITIEDDGVGIVRREGAREGNHFGLDIMRERARCIGGELSIESSPNQGTRVCLAFSGAAGRRSTSL